MEKEAGARPGSAPTAELCWSPSFALFQAGSGPPSAKSWPGAARAGDPGSARCGPAQRLWRRWKGAGLRLAVDQARASAPSGDVTAEQDGNVADWAERRWFQDPVKGPRNRTCVLDAPGEPRAVARPAQPARHAHNLQGPFSDIIAQLKWRLQCAIKRVDPSHAQGGYPAAPGGPLDHPAAGTDISASLA